MNQFISKEERYKYTGDSSQMFYAKSYRILGGKADGVRAVDINNGSGLAFTVVADRGMDIGHLSFLNTNISYITKAGYSSPHSYDDKGNGWLKSFTGGFLTTCGLTQVGTPCETDGEQLGLHGGISAVPAEDFCVEINSEREPPKIIVRGKMRLGSIFSNNLWLTREIRVICGENRIHLSDRVENRDYRDCPYMILYHFNLGFPFLDPSTRIFTSAEFIRPRDDIAKQGVNEKDRFQAPENGFREQVYYYKNRQYGNGLSYAHILNPHRNMSLTFWIDPNELPNLIQWKNAGYGEYVLGIEPSNCYPEGRAKQKEYGLQYLKPLEVKTQSITIDFAEGFNSEFGLQ